MKKIIFFVIIIALLFVNVHAIDEINTDELENTLKNGEYYSFFGNVKDIIQKILNNELDLDGANVLENIIEILFLSIKKSLPTFSVIFGLTILLSFTDKLNIINPGLENVAKLGGRILFTVTVISSVTGLIHSSKEALNTISSFTQVLSPVLITLLASCGAQGSVTNIAPSSILLSSVLIEIIVNVVFPIIILGCTVLSVDSLLPEHKLKGISDLIKSVSAWIIGIIFTVFSGVVIIQGAISSIQDGISIRGIKYAISTSVPVIGGAISESISAVLYSGFVLKSATGLMGIIVIAGIIIIPILSIFSYYVLIKCFCAFTSPFADGFTIEFLKSIGEFIKLIMIILIGIGVLWFVFLGITVMIGNNLL